MQKRFPHSLCAVCIATVFIEAGIIGFSVYSSAYHTISHNSFSVVSASKGPPIEEVDATNIDASVQDLFEFIKYAHGACVDGMRNQQNQNEVQNWILIHSRARCC